MKAFVVTGPRQAAIMDVPPPVAEAGQAVVDIARAGVCGTDVELFSGEMEYFRQGHARYPLRPGHEWSGTITAVGEGVEHACWIGRRVTGDTEIGCGRCSRCTSGLYWTCERRMEIGIRGGFAGALAEQMAVPANGLYPLPDDLDDSAAALVEPGGNALRAVRAAALSPGKRVLVLGLGSIGLLVAMFARAAGAEVHAIGRSQRSIDFARTLAFDGVWHVEELPALSWDAVVDASNAAELPALALDMVEPGGRVVYIGLAGTPSSIDSRGLVLKDVTAVGILGASLGLQGAIDAFSRGVVDPRPLVAGTVALDRTGDVLSGWRPPDAGPGPKVLVDPSAKGALSSPDR